jgi:hypothetical protein
LAFREHHQTFRGSGETGLANAIVGRRRFFENNDITTYAPSAKKPKNVVRR